MTEILKKINGSQDLKKLSIEELCSLAEEIRELITHVVSRTGGHLASNLGVVELTVAMHYAFNFPKDKLLWDVGHQCYAHKILTGRKDGFHDLRQREGLSGFPSPAESEYDHFYVGHAGTSIATALGMALGAWYGKSDEKIVALVGDASIVNGASFEAMNNLGLVKRQLLIVLNDNSMAIDVTQGAIAGFLSKVRLSHTYEDIRRTTSAILDHLPLIGRRMEGALENFKKALRMTISPSRLFESLNIPYFGPVDGHDIGSLIKLFEAISHLNRPVLLHVYTKKGKGFTPADDNPRKFHSTGPFEINGVDTAELGVKRTFTDAFADAVVELAGEDERVVAITAAMPDGTGLAKFRERFGDRYYDVGIAESAAVDIAAGLAKQGRRPLVCMYSTFLQRSVDQIFQEVSLQNLPVIFCIDRAGLVGSDGPTHHGTMDIGFFRMLPNMVIISPACESEMKAALKFALECSGPVAIRYSKDTIQDGVIEKELHGRPYEHGKSVTVRHGSGNIVIAAFGSILSEAIKAADELKKEGIDVTVVNARFAKPVDRAIIDHIFKNRCVITVEDHSAACGFGSAVLELAGKIGFKAKQGFIGRLVTLGVPDEYIDAASRSVQLDQAGISSGKIAETARILNAERVTADK